MSYLDLHDLNQDEKLLREAVHAFAKAVIRPASIELDRMPPEERVKPGSPYFRVMREIRRLGYHRLFFPPEYGGSELTPLGRYIILEELGWGSLGLTTAMGVDMLPFMLVVLFGSQKLQQEVLIPWLEDTEGKYHGCWGITEPDHGSDYLIFFRGADPASLGKGNVIAERDGDTWVIRGQKSAWVSSAPVATHCGLHVQVKDGKSLLDGMFVLVPLNAEGVRRGRPMDMLGARDGPQGELCFDGVRIPDHYVIVAPTPFYPVFCDLLLCLTSTGVGAMAVGLARAAFEEALNYARDRVQGGAPIARHKNIKLKLYEMFEKVETARYYVREVTEHTQRQILERRTFDVSPRHARAAQIYAKKVAFEVAHDALQIFGAYGLSKESLIEKLFRDARAILIEDGTVEVLSLDAAEDVIANYDNAH